MNTELLFKDKYIHMRFSEVITGSKFLYDGENANLSIVSSNKQYA